MRVSSLQFPSFVSKPAAAIVVLLAASACDRPGLASTQATASPLVDSGAATAAAEPEARPPDSDVTLPELLEWAERHAPDRVVAEGVAARGEAEVAAARPRLPVNPEVSLGVGWRRQASGDGVDARFGVSHPLPIAGQRAALLDAAHDAKETYAASLDEATWRVHARVHEAWDRALNAQRRVALAKDVLAFDQVVLELATRRVEVGDEPALSLETYRAEIALAEANVLTQEADARAALATLAREAGWPKSVPLNPMGAPSAVAVPDELDAYVETAQTHSPVLRTTDARTRWASSQVKAADRQAWPNPSIGVELVREGSTTTPGNRNPSSTVVMGTLSWPIPAFSRNQGGRARARAEVVVAKAEARAVRTALAAEIETAHARVEAAAKTAQLLETRVVPTFDRTLSALQRGYEAGELGLLDLALAQDRLLSASMRALEAVDDYYAARADLEALVGREIAGTGEVESVR